MPDLVPFDDLPDEYRKSSLVPKEDLPDNLVKKSNIVPQEDLPDSFAQTSNLVPKEDLPESLWGKTKGLAEKIVLHPVSQEFSKNPLTSALGLGEAAIAPLPGMAMEGATGLASISPQFIGAKKAYDVISGKKTIGDTLKESTDPRQFLNTSKEIIDIGHELQQSKPATAISEFVQPKTETGKLALKGLGYPFEKAHELAEDAQGYWEEQGHYKTGFVNKMLLESAPFLLPYAPKILKSARARGTSPIKITEELKTNAEIKTPVEVKAPKEHIAGEVPFEDLPDSLKIERRKDLTKREEFLKLTPEEKMASDSLPEGFEIQKVPTGLRNPYGTEKLFQTTSLELKMPDGRIAAGELQSLVDTANSFNENIFNKPAKTQGDVTPQSISEQLGKPNQIPVLESLGIKDPIQQKKAIVQDVMRNPQNRETNLKILQDIKDNVINSEINKFKKEGKAPVITSSTIPAIDQMYSDASQIAKEVGQRGSIELPSTPIVGKIDVAGKFKGIYDDIKSGWQELGFYKKISKKYPQLVNDIRTDIIGGNNHLAALENKINTILWVGLKKPQIKLASDIIFLKDKLSRAKLGKGNPNETVEMLQAKLSDLTNKAEPNVISATDKWSKLNEVYFKELVERGKLPKDASIEDYAPHYTVEYTPDWLPTHTLWRSKLRTQSRKYTKEAKGSAKEYRQDPKTLTDHLLSIEADNLIDDFVTKQSAKYDMFDKFSKSEKEKMGLTGGVKPGRMYEDANGNKYWGYNPKKPFSRRFYMTEEGDLALGGYTETYLVPEAVYKTFENFTPKGSKGWYVVNRATSLWKEAALTMRFVSYNVGNIIGDTHLLLTQHPEPLAMPKYIKQSVNFLRNKENIPYVHEFKNWLSSNDVIGSSFIHEIPRLNEGLRGKLWRLSETREALLRVANAKYLFDKLMEHKGAETVAKFDWIDTHGLPENQALGKIAREIIVDYNATSKTYNKLIRGFAAPFGRFYFSASTNLWKFAKKHPAKFIASMSAIPIASEMFNARSDEIKELESQLPDKIRQSSKFVLGQNPDGTIRTLVVQTPQDALIGTKIFTIAYNQAGRVLKGEKTIGQASIDTSKEWWSKEWRGIVFLQNPIARFITGLIKDKDPVDKQPIYPIDKSRLSSASQMYYESMFFLKTMTPMLSGYITETQGKIKTPKQAVMSILDNLAGEGALGLRDFTKRNEIKWDNKIVNYETYNQATDIIKKESSILLSVRDKFIQSGLELPDFIQSENFKSDYNRLVELYQGDANAMESIHESIQNKLENPLTMQLWIDNKIATSKTDEEKKNWGIEKRKYMQEGLKQKIQQLPKRVQKFAIEEK